MKRHKRHHHHHHSRERLLLKCAAAFFGLLLLLSAILLGVNWWERSQGQPQEAEFQLEEKIQYKNKSYVLRDNIETLLVLGLDAKDNASSGSYRNDKQADFLTLLVLDKDTDTCKAIQINRDTMAPVDVLGVNGDRLDTQKMQIALSHTYGTGREVSCRNTAKAVSALLGGVNVQYFVSVSVDAVPLYNDKLGGVPVEIMDDFTSFDPVMKQGETLTLTGEQARLYVQSRQGLDDPTNVHRMERQRQYLQSALQVTKQKLQEDKTFMLSALEELDPYWVSNRTAKGLADLVDQYHIDDPEVFYTIEGTTKMGTEFLEFHPDAESIKEIVVECFYTPVE